MEGLEEQMKKKMKPKLKRMMNKKIDEEGDHGEGGPGGGDLEISALR